MMYYYFAYGSNLNQLQMSFRCPTATPIGAAVLRDYQLTERQFADIDKCPGKAVSGGLWLITAADLHALDRYEGYPTFYMRYQGEVELPGGDTVDAIVYEMTAKAKADRDGLPYSEHYRQICRVGGGDFQIESTF